MSPALAETVASIRRSFRSVDPIVAELVTGVEFRQGANVEGLATLSQRANVGSDECILVCALLWSAGQLHAITRADGLTVLVIPGGAA